MVYLAKHRVTGMIKREVLALEKGQHLSLQTRFRLVPSSKPRMMSTGSSRLSLNKVSMKRLVISMPGFNC